MEIFFSNRQLQKLCAEEKEMARKLGVDAARKLKQRLSELEAAESLDDLRRLPGARCHELTGDRKGQLAVDLAHPKRLIFHADHVRFPRLRQAVWIGQKSRALKSLRSSTIINSRSDDHV